ncbi:hypothetical protein C0J52_12323 [Blattella germanica]|nr:hypothetical protein C0J52_12323 [Blattella germanica]
MSKKSSSIYFQIWNYQRFLIASFTAIIASQCQTENKKEQTNEIYTKEVLYFKYLLESASRNVIGADICITTICKPQLVVEPSYPGKPECKATAITIRTGDTVTILKESDHWHEPNQETVEADFLVNRMKRVATEHPEITPSQILRNELRSVPSGVLSQIPEREHLKRSIRRERTRNQLPDPTSIDELGEIPERYKRTQNGENFLIYDNFNEEEDTQRVIVFGTKKNLELFLKSGSIHDHAKFRCYHIINVSSGTIQLKWISGVALPEFGGDRKSGTQ